VSGISGSKRSPVDHDLSIFRDKLAAFRVGSVLIGAKRHACIFEQELPRLLFRPAGAVDGSRRAPGQRNDKPLPSRGIADTSRPLQARRKSISRPVSGARARGVLAHAMWRFPRKNSVTVLCSGFEAALDVERPPTDSLPSCSAMQVAKLARDFPSRTYQCLRAARPPMFSRISLQRPPECAVRPCHIAENVLAGTRSPAHLEWGH